MWVCWAPGSIWISPSKLARLSPGRGAAPVHVAARRAGLVQVDGEHVEVLVLLGEEQAAEGHVAAGLGDGQLEVLAHEVPAEQRRQPVAVGVAADTDEARRDVVDLAGAPILDLRQAAARAVFQVQLERARVQRLALEVLREVVLVQRTRCCSPPITSVRAYCATPGPSIA